MRYIKSNLALAIFLFSSSCFATAKPEACPSVPFLKSGGVSHAETSLIGWQVGGDANHYDTKEKWIFVMLMIGDKSQSESEVIAKANDKISALVWAQGPQPSRTQPHWECYYRMQDKADPVIGIAATVE